jgi:NTP pyrophosphatase (non-canonical NTP hydrolase)
MLTAMMLNSSTNKIMNLNELRTANVKRCEQVFHPLNAWTPAEWACAMAGEAGEACNVAKKIKRLETGTNTAKDPATIDECRELMGKELADTVIYCDLLAASLGINLADAIRNKFNEVSERMKSDVRL